LRLAHRCSGSRHVHLTNGIDFTERSATPRPVHPESDQSHWSMSLVHFDAVQKSFD
jgi:hypothetical protein